MLYFLVGSRDLDGGLMCTASHNPKAYTGAKLVGRGALALSGDSGIGDVRDHIAAGLGEAPGGGSVSEVDVARRVPGRSAAVHRPGAGQAAEGRRGRRQRHGRTDGRPDPREASGSTSSTAYWTPDGNFPDHEPNPLLPENREFIMREVVAQGADLGIAWDGDADRCFFIDDTGAFLDGDFLTALLAEAMLRQAPGRDGPLRRAGQPRGARHGRAAGGTALINRVGHAFFKTRMRERGRRLRWRGLRPLLLPGLLLRGLGHAAGAADARAALPA